jgi:hypothetical protein
MVIEMLLKNDIPKTNSNDLTLSKINKCNLVNY